MPSTVAFLSAFIRTINTTVTPDNSKVVRINMSASWTKDMQKKMGWTETPKPEGFDNIRTIDEATQSRELEGDLHATTLTFKPNEAALAKSHTVEIAIDQVHGFSLVIMEGGRKELRFQVIAKAAGVLASLEDYCDNVGRAPAECRVSYTKQMALGEQVPEEEEQPALVGGEE